MVVPLAHVPRILAPDEMDRLIPALPTARDRVMVLAMVLPGLRRCEVLNLRLLMCRSRTGACRALIDADVSVVTAMLAAQEICDRAAA